MRIYFRLAIVLVLTLCAGVFAATEALRLADRLGGGSEARGPAGGPPGIGRSAGGPGGAASRAPEVDVARAFATTAQPTITAYGRLASRSTATLRLPAAGTVAALGPSLTDGGMVTAGAMLVQLDTRAAEATLGTAQAAQRRAELALTDSRRQQAALAEDIAIQEQIVQIRQTEVERLSALLDRGAGVQTDVETARLSLLSAQQGLAASRTEMANLSAAEDQLELDIEDARRDVSTARDALQDLTLTAGISGVYNGARPVVGEALSANAELGTITDLTALEVRLNLTAQEIARVTSPDGRLLDLEVTLTTPGSDKAYAARLHHVSLTASEEVGTTRQLVAWLAPEACPCPLPGEFVLAQIREPVLENVTLLPASAVSLSGEVLVVNAENRLETRQVQVLRRIGEQVAIAPQDFTYVVERSPQLGAGLLIAPQLKAADQTTRESAAPASIRTQDANGEAVIKLDDSRRAALIAQVKAAQDMPESLRARTVELLQGDEVPRRLVQRLDARN